jgi:phosphohistidine phosphatase SixA
MKRVLPWALVITLLAAILILLYTYMFVPVTTVILVRHAEKNNDTDTASISAEGWERAGRLSAALSSAGVTHIFVTEKVRTRLTAVPSAERLSIVPSSVPAEDTQQLVDSIRSCRGGTMLVVAHSNTIPAILLALDVHEPVVIARGVYDDLLVVTVAPFRSSVVHLKYGRPS